MKKIKRALSFVLTGVLLLSSSNVFAQNSEDESVANSVEVNSMWSFMWPEGYEITKIHTEGCDIKCLKTYIVKDGFLSEIIPDIYSDELVKIFAYTDEGIILEVDVKVLNSADISSDTDWAYETTAEMTTTCSETAEMTTTCSETTEMTTTCAKATEMTTTCATTFASKEDKTSTSDYPVSSWREDGGNSAGNSGQDRTDASVTEYTSDSIKSHSERYYHSRSDRPTGILPLMPTGDDDDSKVLFGELLSNPGNNTVEKDDFIYVENYKLGDLNLDGKVELTDLTILSVTILSGIELDGVKKKNADIDENNIIDIADLARFKQYISKDPTVQLAVKEAPKFKTYVVRSL